jgi:hypothetical protein
MRSEHPHSALAIIEDLEMQAQGLHLADRAVAAGELGVAHYGEVALVARWHGSVGSQVGVRLVAGPDLRGGLVAAGADWVQVEDERGISSFVALAAVALVEGLGPRAVPADARPVTARLSLRSVLRRLADEQRAVSVHLRGGRVVPGTVLRVGADFVELRQVDGPSAVTVPLGAVTVVQDRP